MAFAKVSRADSALFLAKSRSDLGPRIVKRFADDVERFGAVAAAGAVDQCPCLHLTRQESGRPRGCAAQRRDMRFVGNASRVCLSVLLSWSRKFVRVRQLNPVTASLFSYRPAGLSKLAWGSGRARRSSCDMAVGSDGCPPVLLTRGQALCQRMESKDTIDRLGSASRGDPARQ
jgi:hypothetical protein